MKNLPLVFIRASTPEIETWTLSTLQRIWPTGTAIGICSRNEIMSTAPRRPEAPRASLGGTVGQGRVHPAEIVEITMRVLAQKFASTVKQPQCVMIVGMPSDGDEAAAFIKRFPGTPLVYAYHPGFVPNGDRSSEALAKFKKKRRVLVREILCTDAHDHAVCTAAIRAASISPIMREILNASIRVSELAARPSPAAQTIRVPVPLAGTAHDASMSRYA